jgi:predicted short-subunit dehydrogenase-like oxidoreductase (DUF2520 family)
MKVAIIGSGNVATHLIKALKSASIEIVGLWSRSSVNANQLAEAENIPSIASIAELIQIPSELLLIAIKDDAIPSLATQLENYTGIVAHVSGAVSLDSLYPAAKRAVIYPFQTFSKQKDLDFSQVPLCIEANESEVLAEVQQLANKLSNKVVEVSSDKRRYLHLAAVFACNFPNYLYGVAQQILQEHQLDFELIRPLIKETAEKVQSEMPQQVQTGPAIRNDQKTMESHQQMLIHHENLTAIYKLLSEQIQAQTN